MAIRTAAGRWPVARDGVAVLAVALGCFFGVVVFLPPEGRIAAPLHDALALLLGHATFILPLALVAAGGLTVLCSFFPDMPVPRSRLVGLGLLTLAALPAEHLLGLPPNGSLARAEAHEGTGLVGHWLGSALLDWLGGPATTIVLIGLLLVGALLAFDLTVAQVARTSAQAFRWCRARARPPTRAAEAAIELPANEWQRPAAVSAPPVVEQTAAGWHLPKLNLLKARTADDEVSPSDLTARAQVIEDTLASFNIDASVIEMNQGPTVTQFGIEPAPGVAVNRILSRQSDLALRLGASPIRLEAPVPGKTMVGVEVPNAAVATVTLRDVLASDEWATSKASLRLGLGRDVSGAAVVGDLARMPHLLIAGATGSGKSVCINTIIGSLLFQLTPDQLQLLLIDPKRVELVGFGDLPHLRLPVITEMDRVVGALKWVVLEMDRRYTLFAQHAVRNLEGYNKLQPALPYLVVVIDELADMMMTAAEDVEKTLCRLAQLARATGIHLVVATQRPSVDVLTGLIKANFPTRVAFAVSSQTDSRVVIDQAGAEKLLGRGDALFLPPDAMKPIRLQGAFVSDDEMLDLVSFWKAQGGPRYTPEDVEQIAALGRGEDEDGDVYERACELAERVGRLSTSLLARRLGIGQARAQRLLARLIEEGVAEE